MNSNVIYLNGEYVSKEKAKISVYDRGILYGDGFFEGIRIYNGKIFKENEHLDRLFDSSKFSMIPMKLTKDDLSRIMKELIKLNNIKDGYIRLIVTRGSYDLGLKPPKDELLNPTVICIASNIKLYDQKYYDEGMNVIFSSMVKSSPISFDSQLKSLNYMSNVLAKMEAINRGAQEAILLNENGVVAECTGDNIFILKDNKIYTPPIHIGILNGVTRNLVIELCKNLGYEVFEKEFTRFNVYTSDECFLTGTAAEVIGVTSVDDRCIGNGSVGKITLTIMKAFKDYINKVCI